MVRRPIAYRTEKLTYPSDVATWNNTGASDEGSVNVGDDSTIKIGHYHDIELLWAGDKLHGTGRVSEYNKAY